MLFIRKTALFLSLFFYISCNNSESNFNPEIVTEFGTPVELQGEQLFENAMGIATFTLLDSLILFSTWDDEEMFQVYDLQENLISSFGRQGNGPGEYTSPPYFRDTHFTENGNTHILFYDEANNMTGVVLDITASIHENSVIIDKEFKLPEVFSHPLVNLFHIDGNTYLGTYGDQFFQVFDGQEGGWYYTPSDTSVIPFSMLNLQMEPFDAIPESNLNIRSIRVSPDRVKFASALMYAPVIEIFDIYSEDPLQIQVTSEPFPPPSPFSPDDYYESHLTEYFRHIDTSNEYIYLLYTGQEMSEPEKEQFIKVIDWQGHPVQQYSIPAEYDINWFQVDESKNHLYGLSWNNDALYRFDL